MQELLSLRCDGLILLGPTMKAADLDAIGRLTPTVALHDRCPRTSTSSAPTTSPVPASPPGTSSSSVTPGSCTSTAAARPARPNVGAATSKPCAPPAWSDLISIQPGGLTEEHGRDAAQHVLAVEESVRATAAFVFNDQCAAGYLDTFRRAGIRVPEEHSVVGFDNSRVARSLSTQLTTIGQNIAELSRSAVAPSGGRSAAAMRRTVLIAPELIVRESTARRARTA